MPQGLCLIPAPPGVVAVLHEGAVVLRILLAPSPDEALRHLPRAERTHPAPIIRPLLDYLEGRRPRLDLPHRLDGLTPFRRQVLEEVRRIPYGRTASYADIARRIGKPTACRAVGQALAANPLPILIPCHRVVRADGTPGGFMATPDDPAGWKTFLLDLERRTSPADKA